MPQTNTSAKYRYAAIVIAASIYAGLAMATEEPVSDAYLRGYITSLLQREFNWEPSTYRMAVKDGKVEIALTEQSPITRSIAIQRLEEIPGVKELKVHVAKYDELFGSPSAARTPRERLLLSLGADPSHVTLPTGHLFRPLLADPKEPQFFVSAHEYHATRLRTTMGTVAYGQPFGFYRRPGENPGDGLQIDFSGALFAQFDMYSDSTDLVMADYIFGIPVTYRRGHYGLRTQLYHQSSHLGDEFLLRNRPDRINLNFEALEILNAYEFGGARAYLGGQYIIRRSPEDLKQLAGHGGFEYRSTRRYWDTFHAIAGIDLKAWEQHKWSVDKSVKVGVDFGADDPGSRHLRFTLEGYNGYSPYGQLFEDAYVTYYGAGIGFGF